MSKAFDKVWHEGLIFGLRQFGITGTLISMLENDLTEQSQRVVLHGKHLLSDMIDALIKRVSVTYRCYEMYAHRGKKVQLLVF